MLQNPDKHSLFPGLSPPAGWFCLSGTPLRRGGRGGYLPRPPRQRWRGRRSPCPRCPVPTSPAPAAWRPAGRTMALVTSAGPALRPSGHRPWQGAGPRRRAAARPQPAWVWTAALEGLLLPDGWLLPGRDWVRHNIAVVSNIPSKVSSQAGPPCCLHVLLGRTGPWGPRAPHSRCYRRCGGEVVAGGLPVALWGKQ